VAERVAERTFLYSIEADDTLGSVSEAWLEFARENRADELTRENVLGRPIWRFIAGDETRRLYEGLFQRVRSGDEAIEVPFRCDSPDRFRMMRLVLRPGRQGRIECEGILVREQERPFYSILDKAFPHSDARLRMCSLCKRVHAFDLRWMELEDGIREMRLFDTTEPPELDYVICDACSARQEAAWGSACA
jgi:hypothetical protein